MADGECRVLVGLIGESRWNERLARYPFDGGQDPRIGDAGASQLEDEPDLARRLGHLKARPNRFKVGSSVKLRSIGVSAMAPDRTA